MDFSILTEKKGPLPVWAWGGIGLLGALAMAGYNSGKAPAKAADSNSQAGDTVPSDQVPSWILQITNQAPVIPNPDATTPSTPNVPCPPADCCPPVCPPSPRPPDPVPSTPAPPAPAPAASTPPKTSPVTPGSLLPPIPGQSSKPPPPGSTFQVVPTKPKKVSTVNYTVKSGDTLSSIAKKYHTTAAAIWKYNTTTGNRPAATIKTLLSRGPNTIFAGGTFLIPQ